MYPDIIEMGKAVATAAPDRVIWGSDWLHENNVEMQQIPNDGNFSEYSTRNHP